MHITDINYINYKDLTTAAIANSRPASMQVSCLSRQERKVPSECGTTCPRMSCIIVMMSAIRRVTSAGQLSVWTRVQGCMQASQGNWSVSTC